MLFLAASLFLTDPAPLEMPRAEAYLVKEDGRQRLEDRYNKSDLWVSQTVDGCWVDEEGRTFTLATLKFRPPAVEASETVTRQDFVSQRVPVDTRKRKQIREAVSALSPVEPSEKPDPPRQLPRGYEDVDYWQGTNRTALVCAFLPEKAEAWRLAVWTLTENDDFDAAVKSFEDYFLAREFPALRALKIAASASRKKQQERPAERDLHRADARHSVAAFDTWRATDAADYVILDDLPRDCSLVSILTNDLPRLHRACAEAMPTPIDGSNALCVARLFANRTEYETALAMDGLTNMAWSAAYWSTSRRELVAYLPEGDTGALQKTIRHEAFHQYLSYAAAMIPTSPWLNEGYAQYFEDTESESWGAEFSLTPENLERLADSLPGLLNLDYEAFYAGTDAERRLKYRLAWSIAVFLEKGAAKVRFEPFKNLKRDYFKALLSTQDARQATAAAFRNVETVGLFRSEWLRWWKEHVR